MSVMPIDPATAQSFAALLLAHVLADFTLQTNAMVENKRRPWVFLLHIGTVFILSTLLLGGIWQVALVVSVAHMAIDAVKTWVIPARLRNTLSAFLIDQAAHLVTLAVAAVWWPAAITQGVWANIAPIALPPVILAAGFITTVTAGGYVVGMLTARYQAVADIPKTGPDTGQETGQETGLPDAGRLIGQLERAMIFLFVWIGEPTGVGFLIAAKSVLRIDTAKQGRAASEYVIIGTLASFAWALGTAYTARALLEIAVTVP